MKLFTMASAVVKTVPNVEILHAGVEYNLSTGPTTFTPEDLRDVVMAANEDNSIPQPRLKIGHIDPRFNDEHVFDGSPCFGKATNLRLSDNGMAVYADYTGVPAWLADIMPYAYPSRSVEGWWNVESQMGKQWRFVLTACSALGVTWPGVTVLEDLPQFYGEEVPPGVVIDPESFSLDLVAAATQSTGGDPMKIPGFLKAQGTNASANLDDVRRAFYQEFVPANTEYSWWWIQAVLTDPNELVVEDDENGHLFKIPFSSDASSAVSFGEPEQVRIEYVADTRDAQKAAATHVAAAIASSRTVLASWETRAASRPDDTGGAMDPKEVRKALGLPEDATDEQVQAAFAAAFPAETPEPPAPPAPTPPAPPVPDNVVQLPVPPAPVVAEPESQEPPGAVAAGTGLNLPPGTVLVDAQTLADIRAAGAVASQVLKTTREKDIKTAVSAAIGDGRIPPSRGEHWEKYLETDLEGGQAALASMAPGLIPVEERGYAHAGGSNPDPAGGVQLEDETVSGWSEDLFPEVRKQREAERAAAAAGHSGPPRQRVMSDAHYRR